VTHERSRNVHEEVILYGIFKITSLLCFFASALHLFARLREDASDGQTDSGLPLNEEENCCAPVRQETHHWGLGGIKKSMDRFVGSLLAELEGWTASSDGNRPRGVGAKAERSRGGRNCIVALVSMSRREDFSRRRKTWEGWIFPE